MGRTDRRCAIASPLAAAFLLALGCSLLALGCSHGAQPGPMLPRARSQDEAVYRAAQDDRTAHLEREVARLKADLAQAEEAMVTIESGLRGQHTRADAVSSVADARIAVDRAAQAAPWREQDIDEARAKLGEAERQLRTGHSGSALFFASRAARIAEELNAEAAQVSRLPGARFIDANRANLRSGPSTRDEVVSVLSQATPVFPERSEGSWLLVRTPTGPVGWVHDSVLAPTSAGPRAR